MDTGVSGQYARNLEKNVDESNGVSVQEAASPVYKPALHLTNERLFCSVLFCSVRREYSGLRPHGATRVLSTLE